MKLQRLFLIIAVAVFSLFFSTSFLAAQTYSNKTTTITSGNIIAGNVTGNRGDDNIDTPLANFMYVPQSSNSSSVYNNHVIIESNARVNVGVYGGISRGLGAVYNNTVTFENDAVSGGLIAGGFIDNPISAASVSQNTITFGGESPGNTIVYGGNTTGSGDVFQNNIILTSTANSYVVYGGYSWRGGNVYENRVEIGGLVRAFVVGAVSSDGYGNLTDNTVIIKNGGEVNTRLIGAGTNGTGNITGNIITIEDGGIVINSTTVTPSASSIIGGYIENSSSNGKIENNVINIGGTVYAVIYAGRSESSSGQVINNTVNITSTAILEGSLIYGSNLSGVVGSGNALNVDGFSGSIDTMGNFENYNFVLGQLGGLDGLTYIEITGNAVNIDDSNITISFATEFLNNTINIGDVVTVISSINASAMPMPVTVVSSPFIAYDFIETHDAGALLLTLKSITPQPETKALGEGFAAGLAFLGQAADVRSSIYFVPKSPRFIPFAKMVYGKQYISTGSSIKVEGFSTIAGLALNTNFDNGSQLVVGAFVEGGWGDYDSRNSFKNSATIKGNGDTEYYGGGLLARYAMASGLYGEGTFAAGKTETDFRTYDFVPGTRTKYDYSVPYYSAHLGIGKIFNMCDIFSLDVYGKYLWTRQGGDNVTVDGYRFKFKDADSHRLRAGGKLHATGLPQLQPYVGAAYEYEFSGKIKGSLYGMDMDKPSLRGGTGIGELGLVWSPTDAQNLRVDLGVQGYVGKREGMSGGLTVTMSF